jgi:hypothetical protein
MAWGLEGKERPIVKERKHEGSGDNVYLKLTFGLPYYMRYLPYMPTIPVRSIGDRMLPADKQTSLLYLNIFRPKRMIIRPLDHASIHEAAEKSKKNR